MFHTTLVSQTTCAFKPTSRGHWDHHHRLRLFLFPFIIYFDHLVLIVFIDPAFLPPEQTCADGGGSPLSLTTMSEPSIIFYPNLLEEELRISLPPTISTNTTASSGVRGSDRRGLVWNVSSSSSNKIEWAFFPSVGVVLPNQR